MAAITIGLCDHCFQLHPLTPEFDLSVVEAINVGVPFSLTCYHCDAQADELREAVVSGWNGIAAASDLFGSYFIGNCPACLEEAVS